MSPRLPLVPFPKINSDRLTLRELGTADLGPLFRLLSDPESSRFIDRNADIEAGEAEKVLEKHRKGILEGKWLMWALEGGKTGEMMGTICLWNFTGDGKKAETGFELLPEFRGQGYMGEALGLVLQFAQAELQLKSVGAWTHEKNLPSIGLLEKAGFQLLKTQTEKFHSRDTTENMLVYEKELRP